MDSHRSTSSSKRSRNQSELLAGITNLEPSLSKRSPFSRAEEKLKEFNTPKAPSIRYSDNIQGDAVGVLRVVQLQTAAKTLAVIGSSAVKLDPTGLRYNRS